MHSLKKQTVSLFLITSLSLIGLIYTTMRLEMSRNILPLNTSVTQRVVDNRTNQINSWFGERLAELRLLADLPARHHYSQAELFQETAAVEGFEQHNYVSIRLVSKDGISRSASYPDFSVRNRKYYQDLVAHPKRQYTVSNLLTSREDHRAIVIILYRLARPLTDGTTYLAAAVPLTKVESLAKNLTIYDGKGVILSADNDSPQVNPKTELLLTASLDLLPQWKVNYVVPKKSLGENTQQLLRLLLVIALVVIGLLGLLLILLLRQIIQPIVGLTTTMTQVQAGNRQVRAAETGPSEIRSLATAFNQMLVEVYVSEAQSREASIRVLQAQIQPHFLYNTLDTIQWQILGGDSDAAVTMLENLSIFFRKGLNHGQDVIALADELAHVKSYINIQAVRHPQLAHWDYQIPDDLLSQPLLHFSLQPLVENAINHGLRPANHGHGQLVIQAQQLDDTRLRLTVSNDGAPIPSATLQALNDGSYQGGKNGYGIYNLRQRLQLFYAGQATIHFISTPTLTTVQLDLPIIEGDV
ncbi:sensor histidine kinase [Lactiplantibacillus daowaiensis]|uniref:Sensor histidine kinase n=1 Tax=Lactiplantibacillus daowaiensis TaxID=2559918 RepID=A0ABW1RY21_9LACO|nr:sensor histidine kinase [Lactiplantibacillus daowaiensis]